MGMVHHVLSHAKNSPQQNLGIASFHFCTYGFDWSCEREETYGQLA